MRRQAGFSLIELLITIAIILILAAIVVPNLLKFRMQANESSAVESVRIINTAEISYSAAYPEVGFATQLPDLGPGSGGYSSTSAGLIDSVLASGTKSGYHFLANGVSSGSVNAAYVTNADPAVPGSSGLRHFFSNESGVIRANSAAPATISDNPIQ